MTLDVKKLEAEAFDVLNKIAAGIKRAQESPTVEAFIERFPAVGHVAEKVFAALPYVGTAEIAIDALITYGPLFFAIASAIDVKPMDANQMAEDDTKFHAGFSAD